MAKNNTNPRPSSRTSSLSSVNELQFPRLSTAQEDTRKKRTVWSNANLVKKKAVASSSSSSSSSLSDDHGSSGSSSNSSISSLSDEDPFAGMNSHINYQQQIEQLKALVPRMEKKRTGTRPKSTGTDLKSTKTSWTESRKTAQPKPSTARRTPASPTQDAQSISLLPPPLQTPTQPPTHLDTDNASLVSVPALSSSSVASDRLSTEDCSPASSVVSDDIAHQGTLLTEEVEADMHHGEQSHARNSMSVITEEEKRRFLTFMQYWTGGWQDWDRSISSASLVGSKTNGSLWAGQSPWEAIGRTWQASAQQLSMAATHAHTSSRLSVGYGPMGPTGYTKEPWTFPHLELTGPLSSPSKDNDDNSMVLSYSMQPRGDTPPSAYQLGTLRQVAHDLHLPSPLHHPAAMRSHERKVQTTPSMVPSVGAVGERFGATYASQRPYPGMNGSTDASFGVFVI